MNDTPHSIVRMIDEHWERTQENPFRAHLGGSMIGKTCERELVYSFRWAARPAFKGRMLRLFDRGHKEEFRFVAFLRQLGIEVREYSERLGYHADSDCYVTSDWESISEIETGQLVDVTSDEFHQARAKAQGVTVKQWRISDVNGHFGGSLDGKGIADFPIPVDDRHLPSDISEGRYPFARFIPANEQFLLEFKTHNARSFMKLELEGVAKAKPVHYAQMQIYMHKTGLKWALYMAVNKNDDSLYVEIINYDPAEGPKLIERAQRVIAARTLPSRVGKHASWHECKFCDYQQHCHYAKPLERHCRSCKHSQAVENGEWRCALWNAIIPVDAIPKGCDNYSQITD